MCGYVVVVGVAFVSLLFCFIFAVLCCVEFVMVGRYVLLYIFSNIFLCFSFAVVWLCGVKYSFSLYISLLF